VLALHGALILTARLALSGAVLAVATCCVHVKHLHGSALRFFEVAAFAMIIAAAIATGALVGDLLLAAVAELMLLGALVAPAVVATTASR
jgi:hypothetical protein